jgi:FkbM family methyltransferase
VTDEADLIQQYHSRGEFYEQEELDMIENYFDGGVFIDIGTNVGNHAIYAALFLPVTRIICIEPNPGAIAVLRANIQLNMLEICDTRYLGIGLSDFPGSASLHQLEHHNAGRTQLIEGSGSIRLAAGDDLFQVEHPSFLKIDVEGLEVKVLNGLERLIQRCSPRIFIEVDNENILEFNEWLARNSYKVVDQFRRYAQNINFVLVRSTDMS